MCGRERTQIAEALADFLTQMEEMRFSNCGIVVAELDECCKGMTKSSRLSSSVQKLSPTVRGFSIISEEVAYIPAKDDSLHASTSIRKLLHELLEARQEGEKAGWNRPNVLAIWQGLRTILNDMCDMGFFRDLREWSHEGSILYHWDLMPRNILVKRVDPEGSKSSTGA